MDAAQLKPLSSVEAGQTVRLAAIHAGRGLRSRLVAMGLGPNVQITVVNNRHPGPFVISVRGAKMMLGRGMADKIMVT